MAATFISTPYSILQFRLNFIVNLINYIVMEKLVSKTKKTALKQQEELLKFVNIFFTDNSAGDLSEVLNALISHFLLSPDDWTEEFRNRAVIDTNTVTEFLTKLQEYNSVAQIKKV